MSTQIADPVNPGARYREIFESSAAGAATKGGIADRLRDRLVREEWVRLAKRGWEVVELANYHAWPVRVDLGELGIVAIPAATAAEPGRARIETPRISMRDLGDGNFIPVSVLPSELAQEVEREYQKTGGVVWYAAGTAPSDAAVREARARQMSWYREEFRKAVQSWSRYRQHQFITERQRDAAKALVEAGEIATLPEWVNLTRDASERTLCPECGEEIKPAARVCRFCHFRLLPPESEGAGELEANTARRARPRRGAEPAQ